VDAPVVTTMTLKSMTFKSMTLKSMIGVLAGYVGARFLGAGLGLLTQLVLARTLLPADVTTVFMAMSAAAFLSLLMNGGEAQLASTHLPKLMAHNRVSIIQAFHAAALRNMLLVMAGLWILLIAVWLSQGLPQHVILALAVGLFSAPLSGLARYNAMVANSLRWFPLSYVPDFIVRPGLFLLAIFTFIAIGLQHNVLAVLGAFAAFVWLVGIGQALLMQGQGLRPKFLFAYDRRYARALRPRSVALLIVSVVAFAFADIVMLLAGLLLPAEDAAVAGVAIRLAAIAGFILQAAQLFVLPDFAQAIARNHEEQANAILWKMNSLTLVVVLGGLIATLVLGPFLLSLFGPIYPTGAGILVLLLVGQSVRAMSGMNQNLLSIKGHQIKTAWSCLLALAVLLGAAVLLCSRLGMIGLGYAVIAAELTWMLGLASQSQRLCNRRADLLWLARNA
jgi:O-antigen/teichoic acid export membrane protein